MEYRAISQDEYISHYGRKGMRWGHRKDGGPQGYLGTYPNGDNKLTLEDIKKAATIKGMRWGNRKAGNNIIGRYKKYASERRKKKIAKLNAKIENRRQKNEIKYKKKQYKLQKQPIRNRSIADLSDEELVNAVRRMQLEKQYADLTRKPEPVKKVGLGRQLMSTIGEGALRGAGVGAAKITTQMMINAYNSRVEDKK